MSEKSDFNELLDAIRARPAMYLGEASLFSLWLFLAGYRCALDQHQLPDEMGDWADIKFLVYVARHTDKKSVGCRSYHTMILPHVGGDEVQALELFWRLLDDFRAEQAHNETQNIHD